ncbi:hypothetical protein EDC22_105223 [Tepidamorphus gemmatus]|uniref:DUF1566 domain-containing protein n=2 Tax=Tepidamorphus gemmatus TaxID=747076 RepID=A0A4R3MCW2_9HYPH|nr:hypothetical protein EDC22_105223 [Tepidamorphus gemmatus]
MKRAEMTRYPGLCLPALLLALIPATATADSIIVVPGSNAGYLYFPASTGGPGEEQTHLVSVQKEDGYTDFRITSLPAGIDCDASCDAASAELPLGEVTLVIEGNYDLFGIQLPKRGTWSGGCTSAMARTCRFILTTALAEIVRVKVPPSALGAQIPLGADDGPLVRYVGQSGGYHLVAADLHAKSGLKLSESEKKVTGATSMTDGVVNTDTLIANDSGARAAAYCKNLAAETGNQALGGNWYLPAYNELSLLQGLSPAMLTDIFGTGDMKIWSSTEKSDGSGYRAKIKKEGGGFEKMEEKEKNKTDSLTLCFKRINP